MERLRGLANDGVSALGTLAGGMGDHRRMPEQIAAPGSGFVKRNDVVKVGFRQWRGADGRQNLAFGLPRS